VSAQQERLRLNIFEGSGRLILCLAGLVLAAAVSSEPRAEVRWRSGAVSAPAPMEREELAQAAAELSKAPGTSRFVLYFDGPVQPEERASLQASGIRLLSYLGGHAYYASIAPGADTARLSAVPGALAVEAVDPANKLHPDLARGVVHPWSVTAPAEGDRTSPEVAAYVLFHRDFDLGQARELLARYEATLRSELTALNGVVAHLPFARLPSLAADDDVRYVEPPLPALTELNASNRVRVEADVVNDLPYGLDGSGVSVLVYDGGKVYGHNDLAGRLTVGQSDTGGTSDHATHVACTVGGAGSLHTGMAPGVDIVSYTFEVAGGLSEGFLYTDPGDIQSDYSEAVTLYGADLSNNSISSNTAPNGFPCDWEGNYGTTGAVIDEMVRGSLGEPFRVVWANGNERSSGRCGTTYLTTAPPACAKNHLTVGALNSDDDSVTSFTSWGPCDDGRLKPDVSAPGCQNNDDGGVTSCSAGGGYGVKCGTSMASPTAAGVAALLLQQYRESFPELPDFRNSLLRAVLAQTAVDLGNPGPDYQSGYGSIRAQDAVEVIRQGRFVEDEIEQGEVYTFTATVLLSTSAGLKVTLAWDDPAGAPDVNPVLVNDLDLRILGPDQTIYHPWTLDPGDPGAPAIQTVRDGVNNIEQVFIPNPQPGVYTIQIEGVNIAEGDSQPFSVASTKTPEFCTAEPGFAGLESALAGDSCGEIDLAWSPGESNCTPSGQIRYNIYRSTSPSFLPNAENRVSAGVAATTFTDFGLEPGLTYHYLVRAADSSSGEDTNLVTRSAPAPVAPDLGAPVFAGLATAAAGSSCGEVLLGWGEAVESCSLPVVYEVHRSTSALFAPGPETLLAVTHASALVDTSVTPGQTHYYLVRARDAAGNQETNELRLGAAPTAFDLELFRSGFESTDEGWTVVPPNDADAGEWEWGDPSGTSYQPEDDDTVDGVNCWITGLLGGSGNGDVDGGTTTLLSAAYDMSNAQSPQVRYSRWFTNDRGGSPGDATDTFLVETSNDDGQSWSVLEEVGQGTPLAWVPVSLPLPVPGTDQMRFRFTARDLGEGSLVEAGIDEFELVDPGQACLQCGDPPPQTLCAISVSQAGDDIRLDWTGQPLGTRAVIYHVTGCESSERVRLGTSTSGSFLHQEAALSTEAFQYRVTFVDECGEEQPFCGDNDCP
jgi:hypothetical protein